MPTGQAVGQKTYPALKEGPGKAVGAFGMQGLGEDAPGPVGQILLQIPQGGDAVDIQAFQPGLYLVDQILPAAPAR